MRNILFRTLLLLLMLSPYTFAEDWPQFLGPNRNGVSAETNLIDRFPTQGPSLLWRSPLGVGKSGIAVLGETACTMFQDETQQYVIAVDVKTGRELWKSPISSAYENAMGNGPRATPTLNGNVVYAFSGDGVLACLSLLNGELLWSVKPLHQLAGIAAEYGMACSPILTNEHVIVTLGVPTATIAAFDRETGRLAWTAGSGNSAGYSSPALLAVKQQVQLVVFHGQGAFGLEPHTGKEIWKFPYITEYNCNVATPISIAGQVLLSAGENHGTTLLDVPTESGGAVQEVWASLGNRSVFRNEWQTSILLDGYLYGFDNVGSAGPVTHLSCIDAKTGQLVWQKKRFGKGNLIAADGKLWCTTMDGELVIVKATPEQYQELDRATLLGQTRQTPALSNGRLFLRDGGEMICVEVKK